MATSLEDIGRDPAWLERMLGAKAVAVHRSHGIGVESRGPGEEGTCGRRRLTGKSGHAPLTDPARSPAFVQLSSTIFRVGRSTASAGWPRNHEPRHRVLTDKDDPGQAVSIASPGATREIQSKNVMNEPRIRPSMSRPACAWSTSQACCAEAWSATSMITT
jgi:hypothetical protein